MSKQDTLQADSMVWADPTQNLKGSFVNVAVVGKPVGREVVK